MVENFSKSTFLRLSNSITYFLHCFHMKILYSFYSLILFLVCDAWQCFIWKLSHHLISFTSAFRFQFFHVRNYFFVSDFIDVTEIYSECKYPIAIDDYNVFQFSNIFIVFFFNAELLLGSWFHWHLLIQITKLFSDSFLLLFLGIRFCHFSHGRKKKKRKARSFCSSLVVWFCANREEPCRPWSRSHQFNFPIHIAWECVSCSFSNGSNVEQEFSDTKKHGIQHWLLLRFLKFKKEGKIQLCSHIV